MSEIRKHGIPTLLVDAGDIFDGTEDIDFQRCQVNLNAMSTMGYDAVALSQNDLVFGDLYIGEQRAAASFPFLSENTIYSEANVVKTVGELSILLASASTESELPNADVSIALGTHTSETLSNADILISPERIEHKPMDLFGSDQHPKEKH